MNCRSNTVRSRSKPLRLASSRERSVDEFTARCRISSTQIRTPNKPEPGQQVLPFQFGDLNAAGPRGESIGGQQQLVAVRPRRLSQDGQRPVLGLAQRHRGMAEQPGDRDDHRAQPA